jgi:hypothetical protein
MQYPMSSHLFKGILLFGLLTFAACTEPESEFQGLPTTENASALPSEIPWFWTEQYLEIEKDLVGFRPASTCRALAYIQMGAYETALPGMTGYTSLTGLIPGWQSPRFPYATDQIDWEIALNAYYARALKFFLFGSSQAALAHIDALESTRLSSLSQGVAQGVVNTSIAWGQDMANEVIAYSETDREGATQIRDPRPASYVPPIGEGLWVQAAYNPNRALFPYWGKVRTFVNEGADLVALPPYTSYVDYSTDPASGYYQQMKEVADAVKNLDFDSEWIAEFWSDDIEGMTFSPPARIFAISNQLIQLEQLPLDRALELYCILGMAINDAAVAAWNSKYIYNTERPETYIHKYIDPGFRSALGRAIGTTGLNPSFPGYPSGHSTFAGVSWAIFDHYFGTHYDFTDNCHFGRSEFRGEPRTYRTWKEMAEENAYSRVPLGVHIRMDCDEGLRLGHAIAENVLRLDLRQPQ